MSLALQLPPRFLAPSLYGARSSSQKLPISGLLAELLKDFLLRGIRGGGWKHAHATVRKRNTDPQKLFKEQKHINNCQACGRPKLVGHMCIHCVTYLTQMFKASRRAGLDRPTLNRKGQLIAAKSDVEKQPRYHKTVASREDKYKQLKEEFEAEEKAQIRRTNARRALQGLGPLNEAGKVPLVQTKPQQPGVFARLRERLTLGRAA